MWCRAVLLASTQRTVLYTSEPLNPQGTASQLCEGDPCFAQEPRLMLLMCVVWKAQWSRLWHAPFFCFGLFVCFCFFPSHWVSNQTRSVWKRMSTRRCTWAEDGSRCRWIPKVSHTSSLPPLSFCLQQSAGEAPTTLKYAKEHRDIFFPASLQTPVLLSHSACHPLSSQDGQAKVVYEPLSKLSRPQASSFHEQPQHRRPASHPAAAMAFLPHTGTVHWPAFPPSFQHHSTGWCFSHN